MRDLSRKQFETSMRELGWTKGGALGYWERNGLGVSEWNYRTLRAALADYVRQGERHDKRKAEDAAAKGKVTP